MEQSKREDVISAILDTVYDNTTNKFEALQLLSECVASYVGTVTVEDTTLTPERRGLFAGMTLSMFAGMVENMKDQIVEYARTATPKG